MDRWIFAQGMDDTISTAGIIPRNKVEAIHSHAEGSCKNFLACNKRESGAVAGDYRGASMHGGHRPIG